MEIVNKPLDNESIAEYQEEERTMMTYRLLVARYRVKELLDIMSNDHISKPEKLEQLKNELSDYFHGQSSFLKAKTMGQLVKKQLKHTLQKNLLLVPKVKQGR